MLPALAACWCCLLWCFPGAFTTPSRTYKITLKTNHAQALGMYHQSACGANSYAWANADLTPALPGCLPHVRLHQNLSWQNHHRLCHAAPFISFPCQNNVVCHTVPTSIAAYQLRASYSSATPNPLTASHLNQQLCVHQPEVTTPFAEPLGVLFQAFPNSIIKSIVMATPINQVSARL